MRDARRIVSKAITIAVGVNLDGKREVLGMTVGNSEAETVWTDCLRTLGRRSLRGSRLVISDAHEGLKAAIRRVMGASSQRYRVGLLKKQPGSGSLACATIRQGARCWETNLKISPGC